MTTQQKYLENGSTKQRAEDSYIETRCGFGNCRPACLQRVNNPKILCLCLCLYTFVQGFAVNGINNVNTTSYERRFQLASSQVAWISSSFDIAAAIFGVIIGFYGNRRHKARILTVAFFVASLGSLCMFLPHFITGLYQWGQTTLDTCSSTPGNPEVCNKEDTGLQRYLTMLIIGQLMHGIGGSTLITVGYSFMDDCVPAVSAPLYIALIGLCQALGPTVGYIVGGAFLNVYVDAPQISKENWQLTPQDPRWVGGWWIGFFLSSILMFLLALPFLLFGAELPTAKHVRETRISEAHVSGDEKKLSQFGNPMKVKEFPSSVLRLLKNPAYVCVALASATGGLVTLSMATFLPKYMQNVFGLTAGRAAMLAGAIIVPGVAIGQIFGGFVLKRWKLKVKSTIRYMIIVVTIALATKCAFFITCDSGQLVGWNTPYENRSETGSLLSTCNMGCNCQASIYKQICDTEGKKYFSPCLAGCSIKSNAKSYTECQCISSMSSNVSSVSVTNCKPNGCNRQLIIFLVVVFVGAAIGGSSLTPILMVILRCTDETDRTFALGFMNFIGRALGTIPGPIIYGAVIDSTCGIWGQNCGHRTSCWIYNTSDMGKYIAILGISFSTLTLLFDCLAYKLYRPPEDKDTTIFVDNSASLPQETYGTDDTDTKM